jgi:predicted nucleic acid-binding protein
MVVFDTTILLPILWSGVPAPNHPQTGEPVERFRARINHLVSYLEKNRTKIIIPTPVLSEILVRAGAAGPDYLALINAQSVFRIVAFDERAAVEVAAMTRRALDAGDKRGGVDGTWSKIKYDRQIVAIAKVEGAAALYSDDAGVRSFGKVVGLTVLGSWELPLPPEDPQTTLTFDD